MTESMGVICNGPRKAGTNALRKVVCALGYRERPGGLVRGRFFESREERLQRRSRPLADIETVLGADETIGAHEPDLITGHIQLRILREPKNIAVSMYRFHRQLGGGKATVEEFRRWITAINVVFFPQTAPFFRKVDRPSVALTVRYEQLFEADTVAMIAQAIGVEPRSVDQAYGVSATWTGAPSNWRDWFDRRTVDDFEPRWAAAVA